VAGLDLRREIEEDGARDGRRLGVHAMGAREAHQLVPRRMEIDLVDAVALAVMCPQLGRVPVRLARQFLLMRAADAPPVRESFGRAHSAPKADTIRRRTGSAANAS